MDGSNPPTTAILRDSVRVTRLSHKQSIPVQLWVSQLLFCSLIIDLYLCLMEKWFKTQQGEKVNIVEHTLEQLQKWPNMKIYIGTDSQDDRPHTVYVTCICYRYGNRGAHFIYHREKVPIIRDMYSRLYDEAVRTIDTAQLIDSEIPVAFEALEFDYNYIPKWASNKLLAAVGGWVKGLNYNATFKGAEVISTKAADHVARHDE